MRARGDERAEAARRGARALLLALVYIRRVAVAVLRAGLQEWVRAHQHRLVD